MKYDPDMEGISGEGLLEHLDGEDVNYEPAQEDVETAPKRYSANDKNTFKAEHQKRKRILNGLRKNRRKTIKAIKAKHKNGLAMLDAQKQTIANKYAASMRTLDEEQSAIHAKYKTVLEELDAGLVNSVDAEERAEQNLAHAYSDLRTAEIFMNSDFPDHINAYVEDYIVAQEDKITQERQENKARKTQIKKDGRRAIRRAYMGMPYRALKKALKIGAVQDVLTPADIRAAIKEDLKKSDHRCQKHVEMIEDTLADDQAIQETARRACAERHLTAEQRTHYLKKLDTYTAAKAGFAQAQKDRAAYATHHEEQAMVCEQGIQSELQEVEAQRVAAKLGMDKSLAALGPQREALGVAKTEALADVDKQIEIALNNLNALKIEGVKYEYIPADSRRVGAYGRGVKGKVVHPRGAFRKAADAYVGRVSQGRDGHWRKAGEAFANGTYAGEFKEGLHAMADAFTGKRHSTRPTQSHRPGFRPR